MLRWHENLPLIGWLRLKGRCSSCRTAISRRYPLVELLTALLFAACGWRFGAQPATLLWCAAVALMVAMALIDLDTTLLPDDLTLPLIGLGRSRRLRTRLDGTTLEAAACGCRCRLRRSVAACLLATRSCVGVEGMGDGDFKLLAGLGALLGWQLLPSIVLLASAVGAVVGIAMIAFGGHKREVPIPFGPFLVGGGIAALFFGQQLTRAVVSCACETRCTGLTGGIGSGKSTVAAMLVACGAMLVDTDAIAHALTAPGGAALPALAGEFGPDIVAADGAMDRDRMRALAFGDPGAMRRLESILHPMIGAEATRQASLAGAKPVVFDVPLLTASSHWRQRVTRVLVVDCLEATQMQRVVQRSGWTEEQVRRVIAQQSTRRAPARYGRCSDLQRRLVAGRASRRGPQLVEPLEQPFSRQRNGRVKQLSAAFGRHSLYA